MKNLSKLTLGSIVVAIGVVLLSCFGFLKLVVNQPETLTTVTPDTPKSNITALKNTHDGDRVNLKFNDNIINAVVARSENKQELGLMDVTEMPDNEGMLFVFDELQPRIFWMKNTLISLDIIYLNENLTVVSIAKNTKVNQTTEVYPSKYPASYVLEVNGGISDELGLDIGESLTR